MGRTFANITVGGQTQDTLVSYLRQIKRNAYVSPTVDNFTVIFDEKSDRDGIELSNLTSKLSRHFNCSALAIYIYDESAFYYGLYKNGQLLDEYISNPGACDSELGSFPEGGDAQLLCKVFNATKSTNLVRPILREPSTEKVALLNE